MRQTVKISTLVFVLAVLGLICFSAFPSEASYSVAFADGQYVKLGYAADSPLVWEAKILTGTGNGEKTIFLGSPVFTGNTYGKTSAWEDSNVKQYLNEMYIGSHFPLDELTTGVLLPYGDSPFYDVVVPGAVLVPQPSSNSQPPASIPPSSAGDALIWILDVQEIQATFNGAPDIPWNDPTGYMQRLPYCFGGPYRTRSLDSDDPSVLWSVNSDGSFSREPVASPASVRPVVLPDSSVMLYKRGAGTQAEPYEVCYHWNVIPGVSVRAGGNTITLSFPEAVADNNALPGPKEWNITDGSGTK